MDELSLENQLRESASNDEWVYVLAEYFLAHELAYGHGTDNASDEAYWLVRHCQDWNDDRWDREPDPGLAPAVARLAVRRAREQIPLAYLINEAWFAGLKFFVDQRVLVPRSPCAELIERCFEPWCQLKQDDRVLDVGTGSGCIAIAVAKHCGGVRVDATDASEPALEVARRNVAAHHISSAVSLYRADLFPRERRRYRVIISNPPYVSEAEYAQLPREYSYEPRQGLIGGVSGIEPVLRLIAGASEHLTEDGALIVEVGNSQEVLENALPDLPVVWVDFERGGEGVFVLFAEQLTAYLKHRQLPDAPNIGNEQSNS